MKSVLFLGSVSLCFRGRCAIEHCLRQFYFELNRLNVGKIVNKSILSSVINVTISVIISLFVP